MDNNKKQRKIDLKLLSRIDSLPALENAHIHFIATSDKHEDEYYYWVLKSERLGFESTLSTQSGSILAVIPNIFFGSTLTMTVFLKSEKINNNKIGGFCSRILKEREKNKQDIFSTLSFIPRSDPHPFIGNAIWYDTQLEEMEELFFGNFYIVYVAIIGFNGNDVKGQFFIDDSPIGDPLILQVESNAIQTNCFISKRNIRANQTKSKLTFKLSSINQKDFFERNYSIFIISECSNRTIIVPTNIQEVIVGPLRIIENNYHPCKYTAITVKEIDSDEEGNIHQVKVFDEAISSAVRSFPIIGNSKSKEVEIVAENYKVGGKECNQSEIHIPNSGIWRRDYSYKYSNTSNIIVPLDCIWPTSLICKQSHSFIVHSCRHTKEIPIIIYPDVKWEVKLSLEINDKLKKDIELEIECEWDIYKSFAILKDNYIYSNTDNLKAYLKNVILNKLENYINLCTSLAEFISEFQVAFQIGKEALIENHGSRLPPQRKMLNVNILYPSLSLGLDWKAGVFNSNVGMVGNIVSSGRIIGGQLEFDLFALAERMPYIGNALKALRIAAFFFDIDFIFNLSIEADIKLEGISSFDFASQKSKGNLQFELAIKLQIHSGFFKKDFTQIEINTTESECGIAVEGSGECVGSIEFIPNHDGIYGKFSADFKGLYLSVLSFSEPSITQGQLYKNDNNLEPKNDLEHEEIKSKGKLVIPSKSIYVGELFKII